MVRALVRAIGEPNVRTDSPVIAISGRGPFTVWTRAGAAFDARSVVIATPAYITADLLRERDADLAQRCSDIPYASAATVALAFRRGDIAHPLNGSGFVVPRGERTGIPPGS